MESIIAQSLGRQFVHSGRWDATAEGAELPEPGVVNQNEHDVRRALGRLHRLRELRLGGIEVGAADVALEVVVRPGQHEWRTRCAVGLPLRLAVRGSK